MIDTLAQPNRAFRHCGAAFCGSSHAEIIKCPLKQPLGLGEAARILRARLCAEHNGIIRIAALLGVGYQTVTRRCRVTGLDAIAIVIVNRGIAAANQLIGRINDAFGIFVRCRQLFLRCIDNRLEGGIFHCLTGNQIHIIRAGIVIGVMHTGRIDEMRVHTAQFAGAVVHHLDEVVYRPAGGAGECIGCLKSGRQHQAVQQIFHGDLFAYFESGVAGTGTGRGDVILLNRDNIAQLAIFQCEQGGHHLGCRSRIFFFLLVVRLDDFAGLCVDENRSLCINRDGWIFRVLLLGCCRVRCACLRFFRAGIVRLLGFCLRGLG